MEGDKQTADGVNVQVLLRCRPVSEREVVERTPQVISCSEALREVTLFQNAGGKQLSKTFRFDRVFGPESGQEKLFKQAIVPIVQEVMDGFNCTIFAYGQTGTGKTYTMEGGPRDSSDGRNLSAEAGVIPRSIKQIFDTIEGHNMDSTVKVSFLELYNEELTDLLSFEDGVDAAKKLRLLEDRSGVVVHGLEEVIVRSAAEIYQVLDRGTIKRRTAATLLNNRSSRSHSIFTITIHLKESTPEGEDVIKIGKLNLVDLAGSENISRSGAKDARAREAGSINQSLLTLGRVITTLVEHSGHVPYRDSKLTRLLRDSLGGRTKTCIIATIAPTVQCQEETISTLDYAHRAKNIRNKPELNQKISKTTMIKELAAEIERLRVDLSTTREKNGVYLSVERYEQGELERVQLRDNVKALKAELESEEKAHAVELEALKAAHERDVDAIQSELDGVSQHLAATTDQLNEAQIKVQEREFVIASHQRAEHALAAFGQKAITQLAGCAHDLELLFGKFGEVVELQRGDRSVMQGLRQYVQTRLDQMGAFVADAAATQQQYLAAVSADAAAFKTRKEGDVAMLCDQVKASKAHGATLHQSCSASLADMAALFQRTADDSRTLSSGFSARASAGLQAAQGAAAAVLGSLATGLDQQAGQLHTLGTQHASGVTASLQALRGFGAAAQGQLTEASHSLQQLQAAVADRHQSTDKALGELAAALEASAAAQQRALLDQISGMFTAFAAERSREVGAAVHEMRQQVAKGSSSVSAEATSIQCAVATSVAQLKESEKGVVETVTSTGNKLSQEVAAVHAALKQLGGQAEAAVPSLQGMFEQQQQLLVSYTEDLATQLERGSSAAAAAKDAALGAAGSAGAALELACDSVVEAVQSQHAADVATAGSIQSAATEATKKLSEFSATCAQGTAETGACVGREVSQQLAREPQLAGAPVQRAMEVPSVDAVHELLCPPEDVILQQYRREKAQILRRGGDAKYASLLLSSPQLRPGSPPAAVTVRMPRSPASSGEENQAGSPMCMDGLPSAVAVATKAVPGVAPLRSKIPGAPVFPGAAVGSPGKARLGLADRTNQG